MRNFFLFGGGCGKGSILEGKNLGINQLQALLFDVKDSCCLLPSTNYVKGKKKPRLLKDEIDKELRSIVYMIAN